MPDNDDSNEIIDRDNQQVLKRQFFPEGLHSLIRLCGRSASDCTGLHHDWEAFRIGIGLIGRL